MPPLRDLARLPKAHLHLHFTGSMRVATLAEMAAERRIALPGTLLDAHPLQVPGDERGWFRFQRLYDAARACVRGEADLRRVVDEAAADDAAEGSGRLEIQVDPTSYAPWVGGITPALEIVLDEARAASTRHGLEVGDGLGAGVGRGGEARRVGHIHGHAIRRRDGEHGPAGRSARRASRPRSARPGRESAGGRS